MRHIITENAGYCPYDIVREPGELGLTSTHISCEFGELHVVHRLREASPLTLLIHGLGGTWSSWTPLLQAADVDGVDLGSVLLVDLPGFGASENRLRTLDVATVGRALLGIADQFGGDVVRIIGQSMGAYLALDLAARWPDRVSHVTALAGSFETIIGVGRAPVAFALRHPRATLLNLAFFAAGKLGGPGRHLAAGLRSRGARSLFDRITAHPDQLRPSVASALAGSFAAKNLLYAARNVRHDGRLAPWSEITAVASVVWGQLDPLVPPSEEAHTAAVLPKAARSVIEDAAHIMHVERPHEVLRTLAGRTR